MSFEECWMAIVTGVDLFAEADLARVLDVLAQPGIEPTHWGHDERAELPMDAEAMLAWATSQRPPMNPGIARKQTPTWRGDIKHLGDGLCFLWIEWGPLDDEQVELPYDLADRLSSVLLPVFGYVQPVFTGVGKLWNQVAVRDGRNFRAAGFRGVCSRTWFGSELVAGFGADFLRKAPAVVTDAPGGGLRLDLLEAPWSKDPTELVAAQKKAMRYLKPAGMFGDFSQFNKAKPGPRWKPPLGR